jgi:hypothetical protein
MGGSGLWVEANHPPSPPPAFPLAFLTQLVRPPAGSGDRPPEQESRGQGGGRVGESLFQKTPPLATSLDVGIFHRRAEE